MKKIARIIMAGTIPLTLTLGACTNTALPDEGLTDSNVPIAVHTRVAATGNTYANGSSARLIFWLDNEFHTKLVQGDNAATPRFTVVLDKDINDYTFDSQIYYETPYTYPIVRENVSNGIIHATGYAPANALATAEGQGYTELTVHADYQKGQTDFLTCEGKEAHSASSEKNFLLEEKELVFKHVTAKISFHARRDDEMYGKVGVRNITLKIQNEDRQLVVPTTLQLYADDANEDGDDYTTYVAGTTEAYNSNNALTYTPAVTAHGTEDFVNIGNLYVLSKDITYGASDGQFNPQEHPKENTAGGTTLSGTPPTVTFDLNAELFNSAVQGSVGIYHTWEGVTITTETWEDFITGSKFLPGYEYKIYITFDRVGISIVAESVPWESEQVHEYPVHPRNSLTTTE